MKKIVLVVLVALVGFVAQAQEKKNKNAKHVTEVNGNCGLCQKRIQKAALSVEGVKSATWDIPSHQLSLILNEEKCSLLDVKKASIRIFWGVMLFLPSITNFRLRKNKTKTVSQNSKP